MRNTVKRENLSFSSGKTVSFKKRLGNATFPYLAVSLKSAFSTHTSSWPFKLFLDVDLCCLTTFSCMSTYDLLRPPFLFNVQWAAMGKPGHFCGLIVLFKKFFFLSWWKWFGTLLLSVTLWALPCISTCASSHSQLLHGPICSQCHCICPCRHYLVLIFCWAANLQIMAYRMPIYQEYSTTYSWSCQSGIYIRISSFWSYVLFPTFFIKNITLKQRCSL